MSTGTTESALTRIPSVRLTMVMVFSVTAAVTQAQSPLPVRQSSVIDSMEDFKGVLIEIDGETVQVEQIVWEILPDQTLGIQEFFGSDAAGQPMHSRRTVAMDDQAVVIGTLADFYGFILSDPTGSDAVLVNNIVRGTDQDGFLMILEYDGVDLATGEEVSYRADRANCGLHESWYCDPNTCKNPATCSAYPECECQGTSGYCIAHHDTECSGDCPHGTICNGSVQDCKCVSSIPIPTVSEWGLIVMTLLFLTTGTVVIGRRRREASAD